MPFFDLECGREGRGKRAQWLPRSELGKNYMEKTAVIILAAGKGTRMKSPTAKVLHLIRNTPMIQFVLDTAVQLAGDNIVVVVGTQADRVKDIVSASYPEVGFALQEYQLGTGHAVLCALPELDESIEHVLILCGDVPFLRIKTLSRLVHTHVTQNNSITIVGARLNNPHGYGRLVMNDRNQVTRIVEEADAKEEEKRITLINTGIYCVQRPSLAAMLGQVKSDNVQKEIYLTDIVAIAADEGMPIGMIECKDQNEILGINTIQDLERAESVISSDEKP